MSQPRPCFEVNGKENIFLQIKGKYIYDVYSRIFYICTDNEVMTCIPEEHFPGGIATMIKMMEDEYRKQQKAYQAKLDAESDIELINTLRSRGIKIKSKEPRTDEERQLWRAYDRQYKRKAKLKKREIIIPPPIPNESISTVSSESVDEVVTQMEQLQVSPSC